MQNKKKALPLHPQMSKMTEWVAACSKTTSTGFQHPMERWQSGRMHRSWKPAYWEVPGVRIPLSPLYVVKLWVPNIPEHCLFQLDQPYTPHGEMAEWSNAPVLKTGVLRGTGGSNPSLSATNAENQQIAKQTPSFTPKNVKLGVFVLFKISFMVSYIKVVKWSLVYYHLTTFFWFILWCRVWGLWAQ